MNTLINKSNMKPTESISQEAKTKDGRNIIVSIDSFKEPIGKNADGEFFNLQTFVDRKTKNEIGRLMFPKATKELLEKQMEIAINNIDQYLDVISKGQ